MNVLYCKYTMYNYCKRTLYKIKHYLKIFKITASFQPMKHLIYSVTLRSEPPKLFAEPCNESDHCYKKELRVNFVQIFVIQWTVHQQLDRF